MWYYLFLESEFVVCTSVAFFLVQIVMLIQIYISLIVAQPVLRNEHMTNVAVIIAHLHGIRALFWEMWAAVRIDKKSIKSGQIGREYQLESDVLSWKHARWFRLTIGPLHHQCGLQEFVSRKFHKSRNEGWGGILVPLDVHTAVIWW